MSIFDTCVITASDERQAGVFRALLARRLEASLYPREIRFEVCADPPEGRVGSGGGTLRALRLMRERGSSGRGFSRALVIHAGGESRRLPAYVPEGKLFAPLPTPSSSLVQPAILDHMLALYLRYPWRDGGLVVSSGDVVIDFETELLDLPDAALCGFAAPESFELGSRHGVFAFDPLAGTVRDYFQKAPRERLEREARIEGREACALDLGIASFRGEALEALEELASRKAGTPFRFDLYLELMMASLGSLGFEGYLSRVAGSTRLTRGELAEFYELLPSLRPGRRPGQEPTLPPLRKRPRVRRLLPRSAREGPRVLLRLSQRGSSRPKPAIASSPRDAWRRTWSPAAPSHTPRTALA